MTDNHNTVMSDNDYHSILEELIQHVLNCRANMMRVSDSNLPLEEKTVYLSMAQKELERAEYARKLFEKNCL